MIDEIDKIHHKTGRTRSFSKLRSFGKKIKKDGKKLSVVFISDISIFFDITPEHVTAPALKKKKKKKKKRKLMRKEREKKKKKRQRLVRPLRQCLQ